MNGIAGNAGVMVPQRVERADQLIPRGQSEESALVAAQGRAEIEAAYVMAAQRPRLTDQARLKVLEACKRPTFAKAAVYSKPQGQTRIEGLSIRAAEEALRCWGNVRVSTSVTLETESIRKVRVTVSDLENNISFGGEFTLNKTVERRDGAGREILGERKNTGRDTVYIVRATEDEMLVKTAATVSKAIRTHGLRLIPADIQEEMIAACRATARNAKAVDPLAEKKNVLDSFFFNLRVPPNELEQYLGYPVAQLNDAGLAELREVYVTVDEGTPWADVLRAKLEARKAEKDEREKSAPAAAPRGSDAPAGGTGKPDGEKPKTEAVDSAKGQEKPDIVDGVDLTASPSGGDGPRRVRRTSLNQ